MHAEMLIDGFFIGGPCDQSVGKQVIRAPYDGKIVGTAAEGGWGELKTCIDAADDAFKSWRHSSRADRQRLLRGISRLVRERSEELVELLILEVGKPITASRGEVARLALTFDYAADQISTYGKESMQVDTDPRGVGYQSVVERFPIGVVFCIVPYNWPFNLSAHKLAPALATGNTVIVKPSPLAPLTTLSLLRIIHEAGCPPGVVNGWNGHAALAQMALNDPRIKMLSFTGSAAVGWKLKKLMHDRRVTLELGGNASVIVCQDADLEWATSRIISGAYNYAGQICISIQHAIIHESIYPEIKSRLIDAVEHCPFGDPRSPATVCGPLISTEAAEKVQLMIEEAEQLGASRLVGGVRSGTMISPTLLESVPDTAKLSNEEVFGPVLTLESYSDFSDAISRVNRSSYGIQAGVFTHDFRNASRAFQDLEVGGVVINDYPTLRFDNLPYGGVKRSGFGREGVRCAMDEMTDSKVMLTRCI